MEPSVVTYRFTLKTEDHGTAVHAYVMWACADISNTDIALSNTINLEQISQTIYISDLPVTLNPKEILHFQFFEQLPDGQLISYPRETVSINRTIVTPVEITEVESSRVQNHTTTTLRFKMNYFTYFGQNLYVVGSTRELGFWDTNKAFLLSHSGSVGPSSVGPNNLFSDRRYNWQGDLVLKALPNTISYKFFVKDSNSVLFEPGEIRCLSLGSEGGIIEISDTWRWKVLSSSLYSTRFFTTTILSRDNFTDGQVSAIQNGKIRCYFRANVTCVGRDRVLRVVGSIPELGCWNDAGGLDLIPRKIQLPEGYRSAEPLGWYAYTDLPASCYPFEFKFVAVSLSGAPSLWELGENRVASISHPESQHALCLDLWRINFADLSFHGASVFFSFDRVRGSSTVCTYKNISDVGTWASRVGFAHIQISDIFDRSALTAVQEELPVSGYALDPAFLDLTEYGFTAYGENRSKVSADKAAFVRSKVYEENKEKFSSEIDKFYQSNSQWLENYIKLCFLSLKAGSPKSITDSSTPDKEFSRYVTFIQLLCFKQLRSAIDSCAIKHIVVGLDIPFAISEHGSEARFNTDLFMKDFWLGLPPSKENPVGILFAAMPYDLPKAASWLAARVGFFGRLFQALRLSQTINYFRQWIVPRDRCVRAVFGRFEPSMAISYAELETWGLWDIERYARPFIREDILMTLFGADAVAVEDAFFEKNSDGSLSFKKEFSDELSISKARLDEPLNSLRDRHLQSLLRLQGEVLLVRSGSDFTPRPALNVAVSSAGGESLSFAALPPYEQAALMRLHDEFMENKQRCLWAAHGKRILDRVRSATDALVLSDADGAEGELTDEVAMSLSIVPLRVQTHGRRGSDFDDVRNYQFFSVAAPAKDSSPSLAHLWDSGKIESRRLWEEELWESGRAPVSFNSAVAATIMRQHCWSASMLAFFPLDTLMGSSDHLVQGEAGGGTLDLIGFLADAGAEREIREVLEVTKRRN